MVGEEGIAYLVDQDGVIIAHPNRDLLYHSLGELTPQAAATISATIRPYAPRCILMNRVAYA